jgi:hypothetical protein
MGGGSAQKPKETAPPPQAKPINYGKIMAQSSVAAKEQYRDQLAAQIESYPKLERLQLGTIQKISDDLRNPYTQRADAALGAAAEQTTKLTQSGDQIGATAARADQIAQSAQTFAAGPTELDQRIAALGATAMDQRADQVSGVTVDRVGDIRSNAAERALMREAKGYGILGQLEKQASADLSLGRSLSAEQEREAAQSARAGMAARGLGVGNSALAAEVLNRDRFATQREAERRAFAGQVLGQASGIRQVASDINFRRQDTNAARAQQRALFEAESRQQAALANQDANQRQVELNRAFLQNANQNLINSEISRGGYALGALGQTANLYGQQAGAYQNAAGLGLNIANQSMANDPYMRAFAPGTTIGGGTLGTSANMIGNTYNNATQMAGNVAGINASMLDTRYNTWANNNASLQSAYMGAKASENAANMGLQGAAMGASAVVGAAAAACWVARAAFGTATAHWKDYRRAMLRHASDRTIRLYCQHGQALAATLTTPLRRLAARLTLRTLQWSWN